MTTTLWPSERMSRDGLAAFAGAALGLLLGTHLLRRYVDLYPAPMGSRWPLVVFGFGALIAGGCCLFVIIRRREYPWILAFAAIALPMFEPSRAPYHLVDRVIAGFRDLVLVGAAVAFLVRGVRSADELERRTHLEALSWSYGIVAVALVCSALVEDLLPPIRLTWVASAMLATWFMAWVVASLRYQR
jgi:hypothetical protein